jgi:hypothetical protein
MTHEEGLELVATAVLIVVVVALVLTWEPQIILPPAGHGASAYAVGGPRATIGPARR